MDEIKVTGHVPERTKEEEQKAVNVFAEQLLEYAKRLGKRKKPA